MRPAVDSTLSDHESHGERAHSRPIDAPTVSLREFVRAAPNGALCVRVGGRSLPAVLLPLGRVEFDLLVLIQRPVAGARDRGEVANTSAVPSSRAMKPKPLSASSHFTVPVAISSSPLFAKPRGDLAAPGASLPVLAAEPESSGRGLPQHQPPRRPNTARPRQCPAPSSPEMPVVAPQSLTTAARRPSRPSVGHRPSGPGPVTTWDRPACWLSAPMGCGGLSPQKPSCNVFLDAQPGGSGFLPQAVMRSGWLPTKEGS
jgi:hypothetical protein